jgi:hypothetical protein
MSWLQPTAFEQDLVADLRQRWPEVAPMARLVSLATRVEPLLLRNARLHFLPGSATEIESQLWFSRWSARAAAARSSSMPAPRACSPTSCAATTRCSGR